MNNWKKILNELSYRVSSGIPDLTNEQHLMKLWDILKEHNWNLDARVELLKNLDEMSIVKNKKSGNVYPVKKFKPQTQTIVKKNATKDDIEKAKQGAGEDEFDTTTDTDVVKIEPEKAPEKNKKLDQTKTNQATEEFNEGKLSEDGVSDEDFENNPEITKVDKPIDIKEIESRLSKPLPFPKKYLKVLTRLLNTKNQGKISISDFTDAAGGGTLESTAGEIVSMIGMSIDDNEKANQFFDMLSQHTKDNNDGIISSSWIESARKVREGTRGRYDREFGEGNWKFKNAAWDIKDEVEALGIEDYKRDKGFSTDVYFSVEVDGETILDEVSLKKDKKANLLNSTSGRMSDIIIRGNATTEEYKRYDSLYGKPAKELSEDDKKFLKEIEEKYYTEDIPDNVKVSKVKQKQLELHQESLSNNNDSIRNDIDNFLSMSKEKQLERLKQLGKDLNQSKKWAESNLDDYIEIMNGLKNTEGTLSIDMIGEQLKKVFPGKSAKSDMRSRQKTSALLQQLNPESESKKDWDNIVRNSHQHAEETAKYLLENDTAREGLLKSIREDFPLQALMSGEESMSLGDLSADQGTLREIFGVKDFKELEQNLKVRETPEPASIVFSVEGQEEIPISEINTRPDGIGYGGSWKLEMKLHPDFALRLETLKKAR